MLNLNSISPALVLLALASQSALADMPAHPFNALPLRSGACHMNVTDTTDGLKFESSDFEIPKRTALLYGTPYLQLWKNGAGKDNSSIFALVQPYLDQEGHLYANIHVEREHDVGGDHQIRQVDITAEQVSPDQVRLDIRSEKMIDGTQMPTHNDLYGSYANGKLSMNENTEDLQVELSCQLQ